MAGSDSFDDSYSDSDDFFVLGKRPRKEQKSKYGDKKRRRLEKEFDKVTTELHYIPTVFDILDTNGSFKEKCNLVEELNILRNIKMDTHMHKKQREYVVDQYKKLKMQKKNRYQKLEKELQEQVEFKESLKYKILSAKIDKKQKKTLYNRCMHLEQLGPTDSEYIKLKQWIETVLKAVECINVRENVKKKDIGERLVHIQKVLNDEMYGMNKVKEQLLIILNDRLLNKKSGGHSLGLLGKPGTGKTCIVRSLAKALDIPFAQISLGGAHDASFLDGHSYTYVGAEPGIIVKSIIEMGCNNGIIFFDEIDKLCGTPKGMQVAWNLLHITDFSQNNEFRDKYLCDVTIDLSNIWFIYSMNNVKFMDKALKDRIPIIKVKEYGVKDKVHIACNFVIPKVMKKLNMKDSSVLYKRKVIKYIVKKCKRGGGIRTLEKMLFNIFSKINLVKNTLQKDGTTGDFVVTFDTSKFKFPLLLTTDIVDILLKK